MQTTRCIVPLSSIPPAAAELYQSIGGNRAMETMFSEWAYNALTGAATFVVHPSMRRALKERITHVRVTSEVAGYRCELLFQSPGWPSGRSISSITGLSSDDVRCFVESRTGLRLGPGKISGS